MKTRLKLLTVVTAVALTGCAGGGGGGGPNPAQEVFCAFFGQAGDCIQKGQALIQERDRLEQEQQAQAQQSSPSTSAAPPSTFQNLWDQRTVVGLAADVSFVDQYYDQFQAVGSATYSQANLQDFLSLRFSDGSLSAVGHPGIDVFSSSDNLAPNSPFGSPHASYGLIANPRDLGWDYQSFGVWRTSNAAGNWIKAISVGENGAVSVAPLSGAATFTGKLGGLYISPAGQGSVAASDLTVNANFSTRSLSFVSTNTITTIRQSSATAAPQLNLSGTLTYSPGSSAFTGTLTNAGGTMSGTSNGQFYGPTAQELGGVFAVKSPTTVETFVGAYGAKR